MTLKESPSIAVLALLLPCLLLGLQAGCTPTQRAAAELQRLQGTWEGVVVGQESGDKITITITGNSFHFHRDSDFWFETTILLPPGTNPQQLHATIKRCASAQGDNSIGKVVVAIFKIEDGKLILAARNDGSPETPTGFEGTEEGLTRYELSKVQPQEKNAGLTQSRPEMSGSPLSS